MTVSGGCGVNTHLGNATGCAKFTKTSPNRHKWSQGKVTNALRRGLRDHRDSGGMKEFLAKGTALHGQGAVLRSRRVCWGWNMIATVGREEEEAAGAMGKVSLGQVAWQAV